MLQGLVLFSGRKEMKTFQALHSFAVNLARRFFGLIAEFGRGVFEGRLRVAEVIAAIGTGKLPVNVDGNARLASAWAGVIRWKNTRSCGGDD